MIIMALSQFRPAVNGSPYQPFIFSFNPSARQVASFWKNIFEAPDTTKSEVIKINDFVRDIENAYSKMTSLADCISQEQSFYFDFQLQKYYVHLDHDYYFYDAEYEYSRLLGFSKGHPVYIDGILYRPLIESVPDISQQQDIIDQEQLSFINGSVVLRNENGVLDSLIDYPIYGNTIYLRWLETRPNVFDYYINTTYISKTWERITDDESERETDAEDLRIVRFQEEATTDTLIDLIALYVEDYNFTLSIISLLVQDIRKSQNVEIPTETFETDDYEYLSDSYQGKPINLAYGLIRSSEATPVNGETTGNVIYRQAVVLTSLGTVYVLDDNDDWEEVTPDSFDLATGTFTLLEADSRKSSDAPRKCKVVGSVGIAVTHSSDIIKDLNERYLGIVYNDSNYDTTEWEAEEISLETAGVLFNEQVELFEAIRVVQSGSSVMFRYEILPDGRRTIRINDWSRTAISRISKEKIQNIAELPVDTDSENLAASIKIDYSKDYYEDEFLTAWDKSKYDYVFKNYRQGPSRTFETILTTKIHAETRALWDAERLSEIRGIATVNLMGYNYLNLRIYDIIPEIEITPEMVGLGAIQGRKYWGVWKAQVLSIAPDLDSVLNEVTAVLFERIE